MKFLKKVFIPIIALVFTATGLFAQEDVQPELKKRAKHRLDKVAEKLDLSEEQKVAFAEIHKKYRKEAKALKEQTDSREELGELIYTNKKAKLAEIKSLLTPEQYAVFDKIDENRKEKKRKRGQRGRRM